MKFQLNVAQCICITSSIVNKSSFENLEEWINKIKDNCQVETTVVSLLFNKKH